MSAGAQRRVVIAGAGVGGLTLAAALRRRGTDVRVFERAPSLGPVGAGITVQPNAMIALARIGLAEAVAAAGAAVEQGAILDDRGRELASMPAGDVARAVGQPGIALHRARLHAVLLRAVGEGVVETGRAVTGYRDDASSNEIAVILENGAEQPADLLVGADGTRSAVRAALVHDGEPIYAGYTSWRGIAPAGDLAPLGRATESWGRGERFGVVPIGHGEIYWFAVADAPAGGVDRDGPHAELLRRFGGWHAPVRAVLEATPADKIVRTDIADRPPLRSWSAGRVVLLGDAAHPMTPNLGQGGCQAIEDAIVLDACLSSGAPLAEALRAYETKRVTRANRVVVESRRAGAIAQWSNPLACWFRGALMRATPSSAVARRLERSLRFEV